MEAFTCVVRLEQTYWISPVEPELWSGEAFKFGCTAVYNSLKSQKQHTFFTSPTMSSVAETKPILSLNIASPSSEDTAIIVPT